MNESTMKSTWRYDLFRLDDMFTPKIITIIYWLLLAAAVINFIMRLSMASYDFTFGRFLVDLVWLVGGVIAARIWCELLIVIFRINEALQDIRNK